MLEEISREEKSGYKAELPTTQLYEENKKE
jgi:hypothetical protein